MLQRAHSFRFGFLIRPEQLSAGVPDMSSFHGRNAMGEMGNSGPAAHVSAPPRGFSSAVTGMPRVGPAFCEIDRGFPRAACGQWAPSSAALAFQHDKLRLYPFFWGATPNGRSRNRSRNWSCADAENWERAHKPGPKRRAHCLQTAECTHMTYDATHAAHQLIHFLLLPVTPARYYL